MTQTKFEIGKATKIKESNLQTYKNFIARHRIVILASVSLFTLTVITVVVTQYEAGCTTACDNVYSASVISNKARISPKAKVCSCSDNSIICTGATSASEIEEELYNMNTCDATTLRISQSSFTKLPSGFLSGQLPFSLSKLDILSTSLVEIEDDAFNSDTFKDLKELVFENNLIRYVRKDSFKGLLSLGSFSFRMMSMTLIKFEKNLLEHINIIHTLQFNYCILTTEALMNITASNVELTALENVDLRYNKIQTLTAGVFSKLRTVRLFNINNSGIEKIERNAFYGLIELQTLNISYNVLSTLPEGIFDFSKALTRIFIHQNPWNCNCELEWLWNMYKVGGLIYTEIVSTCDNHFGLEFSQVDFCDEDKFTSSRTTAHDDNPEDTTVPEDNPEDATVKEITEDTEDTPVVTSSLAVITTIRPTTSLDENSKRYKDIVCRDWEKSPISIKTVAGDLIYNKTVYTEYEDFTFSFYDPDVEPVELIVFITGNLTGSHLLWFNTFDTSATGCVTNMESPIVLQELSRSNTYTFCMLHSSCEICTVSPFDCFGFEIRVEYSERAWIQNRYSTLATILSILALILSIVTTIIVTYCCIRQHPTLIKGNKRVIIVGKRKPAESVAPREYEKPVYTPPSIDSMLTGATQSNYGYTKIRRRHYRSPILRSLSEHSVFGGEVSYIRPTGPSSYQLNTWRLKSKGGQPYLDAFEESVYGHSPPPLPPPNSKQLEWEENLYTTL